MSGRYGLRPSDIRIEQQRATTARGTRTPNYNFAGVNLAEYALVPTMFAPMLAGDTIAKASVSARVIMPVQQLQRVQGAWFEHWLFLVRIGDMANADDIRAMLIDPNASEIAPDWRQLCMDAIVRNYFLDELYVEKSGWAGWSPGMRIRNPRTGWWDSARTYGGDYIDTVSADPAEWDGQWEVYQQLRRAKLTTKTYEEYLASQGVNVPRPLRPEVGNSVTGDPEAQIPELIQYSREFVYPQMSIAPTTGGTAAPAATLQWFIQDKLARSRFCAEPGFLVAMSAVRSKVYVMTGTGGEGEVAFDPLDFLNTAEGWLPIDFDTDPHTALSTIEGAVFVGDDTATVSVVDLREQFLHGADEVQNGVIRNVPDEVALLIPLTYADPPTGSAPVSGAEPMLSTYAMDAYYSLAVKSRITKDVTA